VNKRSIIPGAVALFVLFPTLAPAQNFTGYKSTTLEAVIEEWNGKTKNDGPGVSFSEPEKIRFVATMSQPPVPLQNWRLGDCAQVDQFHGTAGAGQGEPLRHHRDPQWTRDNRLCLGPACARTE
jgi:hypothetical protein